MAAKIRHIFTVPLAILSFVSVFYAIAKLMAFLSLPVKFPIHQVWIVNLLDDWSRLETSLLPLTTDAILIVVFMLVHSFLRSDVVKEFWNKIGLSSASRSIYNLVTSASLLVKFSVSNLNGFRFDRERSCYSIQRFFYFIFPNEFSYSSW